MALAMSVLPVPGGPKSSRPLGGRRDPVKMSGRMSGHTVISRTWPGLGLGSGLGLGLGLGLG